MKNTVFAALRSYQFHSEVESQRYFEALRLAAEVEKDPGEPLTKMNRGATTKMGALDWDYLVAHYLIQPGQQLLSYQQRDLWSGLGEETNRDTLGFKLATLLAPVGSHWKHYNRPETYEVLAVARYYDRNEQFVVFCNANNPAEIWMRTVDDFFSRVRTPGSLNPPEMGDGWRFVRIVDVEDNTTTEEQFAQQLTELYVGGNDTIIREQQAMTRKLFSRYLKHIGSKAKFISANSYPSGALELVYEDDTSTPTTLWVQPDRADPDPGTTILFALSQAVQPVRAVQAVLDRAAFEVAGAVSVSNMSNAALRDVMAGVSDKFAKQLFPALGTVLSQLTYEAETGSFQLIIQTPAKPTTRAILNRFDAVEENDFLTIIRRWENVRKPTKE